MDCINRIDGYLDMHAWELRRYVKQRPLSAEFDEQGMFLYGYPIDPLGQPSKMRYEQLTGLDRGEVCVCRALVWNAGIESFQMIVPERDYIQSIKPYIQLAIAPDLPLPYYVIPTNVADLRKVEVEMRRMASAVSPMGTVEYLRWIELVEARSRLLTGINEKMANQILFGVPTSPKPQASVKMEVIHKGKYHG